MPSNPKYYIIEASALPDVFLKVAEAKRLLDTGEVATGMGINGYNSLNVQVSKYEGEPIPADCEIPQTILF